MHLFLTGDVQIGKSTILRKVVHALETPVRGFQTYFVGDRASPFKALYMADASAPQEADDARIVARFSGGKPAVYTERFDAIGCALLAHAGQDDGLILMDECGRLERDARLFQQAILGALDGQKLVLGVVAQKGNEWTDRILAHPNVRVFTVTLENRTGSRRCFWRKSEKPSKTHAGNDCARRPGISWVIAISRKRLCADWFRAGDACWIDLWYTLGIF